MGKESVSLTTSDNINHKGLSGLIMVPMPKAVELVE